MRPAEIMTFTKTPAVLNDVDLPFLRVRPETTLGEGRHQLELRIGSKRYQVAVTPVRSCDGGHQWVRLLDGGTTGELLEHRFLQDRLQTSADERRNDSRLRITMSVKSPDLPNERGTVYDVSDHGMRLVTERPVAVGSVLQLEVWDDFSKRVGAPVRISGEAVWTAPQLNSLHHVGVRIK